MGLGQVTGGVTGGEGAGQCLCSWTSPKLKCLDPVSATVLMGREGWTRDLQRSFLTFILFSSGCCV